MTAQKIIAFVQLQQNLVIFEQDSKDLSWQHLSLRDEPQWRLDSDQSWYQALEELNQVFNLSTHLESLLIYFVVEQSDAAFLQQLQQAQQKLNLTSWNLAQWCWLKPYFTEEARPSIEYLQTLLLPQLTQGVTSSLDAALTLQQKNKATQEAFEAQEKSLLEEQIRKNAQLQAEKQALEQKNVELAERLAYVQKHLDQRLSGKMDMDVLLTYLPVLYKNFWGQIRPDELAMLAGTLHTPDIPSPAREPDSGVLQVMKKRLQQLSQEQKHQLQRFCLQLPHAPQPRPEMAFFFESND